MKSNEVKKILVDYLTLKQTMRVYLTCLNSQLRSLQKACDGGWWCPYDTEEVIDRMDKANAHLQQYKMLVTAMIDLVPVELHQSIMSDHYLKGIEWQVIADKYNYSEKHIFNINKQCINAIACALQGVDINTFSVIPAP